MIKPRYTTNLLGVLLVYDGLWFDGDRRKAVHFVFNLLQPLQGCLELGLELIMGILALLQLSVPGENKQRESSIIS